MPRRESSENGRTEEPDILWDVGSESEGLEGDLGETEEEERRQECEFESSNPIPRISVLLRVGREGGSIELGDSVEKVFPHQARVGSCPSKLK